MVYFGMVYITNWRWTSCGLFRSQTLIMRHVHLWPSVQMLSNICCCFHFKCNDQAWGHNTFGVKSILRFWLFQFCFPLISFHEVCVLVVYCLFLPFHVRNKYMEISLKSKQHRNSNTFAAVVSLLMFAFVAFNDISVIACGSGTLKLDLYDLNNLQIH